MTLAPPFSTRGVAERAQRIRQNRVVGYGTAIATLAIATLLRWLAGPYLIEGLPFISYFGAILVATLLGGVGPGLLALLASAILAWFVFIPPEFSFALTTPRLVSLLLFMLMGGIILILAALLNDAIDRMLAQEQKFRSLLEASPDGVIVVDRSGVIRTVNRSVEKLFGYDRLELLGQKVEMLVPESKAVQHKSDREAYQRLPVVRPMGAGRKLSGRRRDGSEFPLEIGLNPVAGNGDDIVLATVVDTTERVRAEDHQQLLIGELQHRSLNMFAVIQLIANRSLDEGHTRDEAKRLFEGRLQALARTHRMLAEAAWAGAPLVELITNELDAFSKRFSLTGCDVLVNTPAAQLFALVTHELATNAVKHGALSAPDGRVSIECNLKRVNGDGTFSFLWRESGGPRVSKPKHKGFGSAILLEAAKQLGQHAELSFEPEGLRYKLHLSLSAIEPSRTPPPTTLTSNRP